jgi:hypothetical protein
VSVCNQEKTAWDVIGFVNSINSGDDARTGGPRTTACGSVATHYTANVFFFAAVWNTVLIAVHAVIAAFTDVAIVWNTVSVAVDAAAARTAAIQSLFISVHHTVGTRELAGCAVHSRRAGAASGTRDTVKTGARSAVAAREATGSIVFGPTVVADRARVTVRARTGAIPVRTIHAGAEAAVDAGGARQAVETVITNGCTDSRRGIDIDVAADFAGAVEIFAAIRAASVEVEPVVDPAVAVVVEPVVELAHLCRDAA